MTTTPADSGSAPAPDGLPPDGGAAPAPPRAGGPAPARKGPPPPGPRPSGGAPPPRPRAGSTGKFPAAPPARTGATGKFPAAPAPPARTGATGKFPAAGPPASPAGSPEPTAATETPEQRTARLRRMRALGLISATDSTVVSPPEGGPPPSASRVMRVSSPAPAPAPPRPRRAPAGPQVPGVVLEALLQRFEDGSTLHAGRQVEPERPVTVHLLPARALGAGRAERITRAAGLLADVDHPGVVRVFACPRLADGGLALVVERLEGMTLRDLAPAGAPLPPDAALAIVRQVAAGLAEAHRRGVVHLGLTPEAVVMAPGPRLAVTGFGVARPPSPLAARDPDLAAARYQAPEQVDGAAVDARADVHALGAVAYELLTGAPPFAGGTAAQALAAVVGGQVAAPHERAPDVPPAASNTVMRMLAGDPAARPASLDDVLRALDDPGAPAPPPRSPPPPLELGATAPLRPSRRGRSGALARRSPSPRGWRSSRRAPRATRGRAPAAPDPSPEAMAAERPAPPPRGHARAERRARPGARAARRRAAGHAGRGRGGARAAAGGEGRRRRAGQPPAGDPGRGHAPARPGAARAGARLARRAGGPRGG
ncbi:MAG: protein kinase [Planctomycetes bacterium]|nr:protein kinase [Planctomycetota bacterium]